MAWNEPGGGKRDPWKSNNKPPDLDALLMDKNKLIAVLTYHVVPGKIQSKDIKPGKVKTVQGSELTIAKTNGGVTVDTAKVTAADIIADNGVIHVIDTVLMPK